MSGVLKVRGQGVRASAEQQRLLQSSVIVHSGGTAAIRHKRHQT